MGKRIEETNNKHGRLTVIEYAGKRRRLAHWKCKCDCGKETIVRGSHLRNGGIKSCGCLQKEIRLKLVDSRTLPKGVAAFNGTFKNMKNSAKARKLTWELTGKQAKKLMDSPCYYCGTSFSNLRKSRYNNGDYKYNGMDRKDNNKGYTLDNVVPCCTLCNRAKANRSYNEFIEWIKGLINYSKKKGLSFDFPR